MIRTAALAGLLLVLLSVAYSRSLLPSAGADPLHARPVAAAEPVVETGEAPALAETPGPAVAAAPQRRSPRTVPVKLLPDEPAETAPKRMSPAEMVREAARPAPAPAEPLPELSEMAAAPPAQHPSSRPDAPPPAIHAFDEQLAAPPAVAEPKMAAPAVPVAAPLEELPERDVATPRVMIPRDLPLPSETAHGARAPTALAEVAVPEEGSLPPAGPTHPAPRKSAAVKEVPMPQLMTPEERTRELYGLARDMEDKFISRLAR